MNKKNKIISTIGFAVTFVIMFFFVHEFFYHKNVAKEYDVVLDENSHVNVFFFGSSHVNNGISPMLLWKHFGIVSYNFARPAQAIPTDYYSMILATEKSKPDLIVIDTVMISKNDMNRDRDFLDVGEYSIPFCYEAPNSINKIKLVNEYSPLEDRFHILFPFSNYHYSWSDATKDSFWKDDIDCSFGYNMTFTTDVTATPYKDVAEWNPENINIPDNVNVDYLEKLIGYCKEQNIKVLLITLPYGATEDQQALINYSNVIAEKNDIPYYNMNCSEVVNDKTDYVESFKEHLNALGAYRATIDLGNYITRNYSFEADNNYIQTEYMNSAYERYEQKQIEILLSLSDLTSYLMFASSMDVKIEAYIYNPFILTNPEWKVFWDSLGYGTEVQSDENTKAFICFGNEYETEMLSDLHMVIYNESKETVIDDVYYTINDGFYRESL